MDIMSIMEAADEAISRVLLEEDECDEIEEFMAYKKVLLGQQKETTKNLTAVAIAEARWWGKICAKYHLSTDRGALAYDVALRGIKKHK